VVQPSKTTFNASAAVAAAMALLESGPLVVILVVFLLLFGAAAIPKLARSLGQARGEFARAKKEFDSEAARAEAQAAAPAAPAPAAGPTEEQVRRTARDLGIQEQGKSLDEVKALIQQRLG
jgi:sec-independent protein translocase protein TatA